MIATELVVQRAKRHGYVLLWIHGDIGEGTGFCRLESKRCIGKMSRRLRQRLYLRDVGRTMDVHNNNDEGVENEGEHLACVPSFS